MEVVRVLDPTDFCKETLFREKRESLAGFDFRELSGGLQAQLVFRLVHEQGTKLLYAVVDETMRYL